MLPVPSLEPWGDTADELGEAGRPLVDKTILLLVRDFEGPDSLPNGTIEELQP
jgi:hypothetical protein